MLTPPGIHSTPPELHRAQAGQASGFPTRVQVVSCGMRGAQVVIHDPAPRHLSSALSVVVVGLFDGVNAQQVMKYEPVRNVLGD